VKAAVLNSMTLGERERVLTASLFNSTKNSFAFTPCFRTQSLPTSQ